MRAIYRQDKIVRIWKEEDQLRQRGIDWVKFMKLISESGS